MWLYLVPLVLFQISDGKRMIRFLRLEILLFIILAEVHGIDRYAVTMWGLSVANVEINSVDSTFQNNVARYISFSTETTSLVSSFFHVDNHYKLWVDPNTYSIWSFEKNTTQPGVENFLKTEIINNKTYYSKTTMVIPKDVFTIFSLLDFIRFNQFTNPFNCLLEREGQVFPAVLIPVSDNENIVQYQLDIDLNFPQDNSPVIEHTDIFSWALYKENVTRVIEVNYNTQKIESCFFTSRLVRLTAKLKK